jgi:hypothetical protein
MGLTSIFDNVASWWHTSWISQQESKEMQIEEAKPTYNSKVLNELSDSLRLFDSDLLYCCEFYLKIAF